MLVLVMTDPEFGPESERGFALETETSCREGVEVEEGEGLEGMEEGRGGMVEGRGGMVEGRDGDKRQRRMQKQKQNQKQRRYK
jgi:hypothetical protein